MIDSYQGTYCNAKLAVIISYPKSMSGIIAMIIQINTAAFIKFLALNFGFYLRAAVVVSIMPGINLPTSFCRIKTKWYLQVMIFVEHCIIAQNTVQ